MQNFLYQESKMPNNFLTKEGYQKLQDELDYLRTAKRQEVANRLHEAMEGGELIENAEYEAAKNEQAFVEGRIQELEVLLATAKIIEENGKKKSDIVQIGSKVTIKEAASSRRHLLSSVWPRPIPAKARSPMNRRSASRSSTTRLTIPSKSKPRAVHIMLKS